jgi:hypothetical protein
VSVQLFSFSFCRTNISDLEGGSGKMGGEILRNFSGESPWALVMLGFLVVLIFRMIKTV